MGDHRTVTNIKH